MSAATAPVVELQQMYLCHTSLALGYRSTTVHFARWYDVDHTLCSLLVMYIGHHKWLQICQELRKAQLLSKEGIEQQSACQVTSLHMMAALISTCTSAQCSTPNQSAPCVTAESLERQQFMLPTQRLVFDGLSISCIDGSAFSQGTAVQSRLL